MKGSIFSLAAAAATALALAPLANAQSVATTSVAMAMHTSAADNSWLSALVPAGLSPEDACRGFGNLSECSAALHASQNLNIPFADIKDRLMSGQSLGTVIHAFRPEADSRREAQRAEKQARDDQAAPG